MSLAIAFQLSLTNDFSRGDVWILPHQTTPGDYHYMERLEPHRQAIRQLLTAHASLEQSDSASEVECQLIFDTEHDRDGRTFLAQVLSLCTCPQVA